MIETLTPGQRAQRDRYNANALKRHDVDLNRYDKPRFGPWCPYWTVYSRVTQSVPPGSRLLIIGCGTGRDALVYAKLGYRVDAIDISNGSICVAQDLARKYNLADKAAFHVQLAERLEFEDQLFDAVVGTNVLHHVNTKACIRETYRVLRSGRRAIFKEPLSTPVRDSVRKIPPVKWLFPQGIKNRATGTPSWRKPPSASSDGVHLLNASDFRDMREVFGNLQITRFHVLAKMSVVVGRRPMLERWDYRLFKILPFVRLLGDQLVLEMIKK